MKRISHAPFYFAASLEVVYEQWRVAKHGCFGGTELVAPGRDADAVGAA